MKQIMPKVRGVWLVSGALLAVLSLAEPALAEEPLPRQPQAYDPGLAAKALDPQALQAHRGEGLSAPPLHQEGFSQDLAVILWDEVARERGQKGTTGTPPASYSTVQVNLGLR